MTYDESDCNPSCNLHFFFFFFRKIRYTRCPQQTLQLTQRMTTFFMFRTIFSWTTTYTHLFSVVYHYYWILMLFLCRSIWEISVLTNMVSRYLVTTLMFIKSPRTMFSSERRTEVLAFHAPLAGFVLFIAYGVDRSFVRPARGLLFDVPLIPWCNNYGLRQFSFCALCFRGKFWLIASSHVHEVNCNWFVNFYLYMFK